jgi:hypothetical protein
MCMWLLTRFVEAPNARPEKQQFSSTLLLTCMLLLCDPIPFPPPPPSIAHSSCSSLPASSVEPPLLSSGQSPQPVPQSTIWCLEEMLIVCDFLVGLQAMPLTVLGLPLRSRLEHTASCFAAFGSRSTVLVGAIGITNLLNVLLRCFSY